MPFISNYIQIRNNKVYKNGLLLFENSAVDFGTFAKNLYQQIGIVYPKFYKMDNLCQLAFLAAEIFLQENEEKNVGMIFCNYEGSLDTDLKYQQLIQDPNNFYPSPAVFVYTLPNICIGEISIRHDFKSESLFLLAKKYQTQYILPYTEYLISSKKSEKVLCGWLQMLGTNYAASLYLVESTGKIQHCESNIETIISTDNTNDYA
jgi:hypothetical protein